MTTGRINQVASVDNTARRRLRAPKSEDGNQVAGQAGVEASVFQGSRDSETGWDRNPTFHPMDRIREDGERPCARTDRDSARQKWNPDVTLKSPDPPRGKIRKDKTQQATRIPLKRYATQGPSDSAPCREGQGENGSGLHADRSMREHGASQQKHTDHDSYTLT